MGGVFEGVCGWVRARAPLGPVGSTNMAEDLLAALDSDKIRLLKCLNCGWFASNFKKCTHAWPMVCYLSWLQVGFALLDVHQQAANS